MSIVSNTADAAERLGVEEAGDRSRSEIFGLPMPYIDMMFGTVEDPAAPAVRSEATALPAPAGDASRPMFFRGAGEG